MMTLPIPIFMIYVAFLTATMFFVAVKPFFELKKGKKIGWLLIFTVYTFNDYFWAYLVRYLKDYKTYVDFRADIWENLGIETKK